MRPYENKTAGDLSTAAFARERSELAVKLLKKKKNSVDRRRSQLESRKMGEVL